MTCQCEGCKKGDGKNLEILVTGAHGFLGKREVERLYKDGFRNVVATDISRHPNFKMPPGFKYEQLNLTDPDNVEKVMKKHKPKLIINNAAIFHFSADPELMNKVNGDGVFNLVQSAREHGMNYFIQTSSGTVYKGGRHSKEDQPLEPLEAYGHSKLLGEELLLKVLKQNKDFKAVNCRLAVIYGPGSKYGFMYAVLAQDLARRLTLGMGGHPLGGRDFEGCYVHVDDVVSAHEHFIHNRDTLMKNNPESLTDMAYNIVDHVALQHRALGEIASDAALELMEEEGYCGIKKAIKRMNTGKCIPLPEKPIMAIADIYGKVHPWLMERGLPNMGLERGNFEYMFAGDISLAWQKLGATGFTWDHPDSRDKEHGMRPIVKEHIRTNWEALYGPYLSKLIGLLGY